jgi:hypothetical protein
MLRVNIIDGFLHLSSWHAPLSLSLALGDGQLLLGQDLWIDGLIIAIKHDLGTGLTLIFSLFKYLLEALKMDKVLATL